MGISTLYTQLSQASQDSAYADTLVPRLGVGLDVVVPVFEATLRRILGFAHLGQP